MWRFGGGLVGWHRVGGKNAATAALGGKMAVEMGWVWVVGVVGKVESAERLQDKGEIVVFCRPKTERRVLWVV